MITAEQYVSDRVGLPYSNDLHCWELTRLIQKDLFGRDLPQVLTEDHLPMLALAREFRRNPERDRWERTHTPEHGAITMMSRPGKISSIHCGTYLEIDSGGVFHTDHGHGVTFENLLEVTLRNWVFEFYLPR